MDARLSAANGAAVNVERFERAAAALGRLGRRRR